MRDHQGVGVCADGDILGNLQLFVDIRDVRLRHIRRWSGQAGGGAEAGFEVFDVFADGFDHRGQRRERNDDPRRQHERRHHAKEKIADQFLIAGEHQRVGRKNTSIEFIRHARADL